MGVATNGFSHSFWKQPTPNARIPSILQFKMNPTSINEFANLYDDSGEQITSNQYYIVSNPKVIAATLNEFVLPVRIDNIPSLRRPAGYSYTIGIRNNDAPERIYLQEGTNTNINGDIIEGSFADSVESSAYFGIRIDPDIFLCRLNEEPSLEPIETVLKTGNKEVTFYRKVRVRTTVCKKTSNMTLQSAVPANLRTAMGFTDESITFIGRSFTACYGAWQNIILKRTIPARPPVVSSHFILNPPVAPDNWEPLMQMVIPLRLTRTVELYEVGSGVFSKDIKDLNIIITSSNLKQVVVE